MGERGGGGGGGGGGADGVVDCGGVKQSDGSPCNTAWLLKRSAWKNQRPDKQTLTEMGVSALESTRRRRKTR